METSQEINNENNSCLLINPEKNILNKSFNILLPQNQSQKRNQRAEKKSQNSTDDTKINANSNLNTSHLKNFS